MLPRQPAVSRPRDNPGIAGELEPGSDAGFAHVSLVGENDHLYRIAIFPGSPGASAVEAGCFAKQKGTHAEGKEIADSLRCVKNP